ncbi:MAG: mechanosensitive ion channel family protein [Actinomycetota bacterium]|nr:mechanosensitive ion channel family protein [Actinomycetota bacterium]
MSDVTSWVDRFVHSQGWRDAVPPLRILLIVVLAVLARVVLHRAIGRLVRQATEGTVPVMLRPLKDRGATVVEATPLLSERRRQRAGTIGSVLRSIASFTIFAVAGSTILAEIGVNLGPVVASAGILGVAVGFGAQNLIKDFLGGMFMILEDQYGVGDVIDAGQATGTVESVGLRSTRLRDADGTVWYIRNGEISRIGNKSQGWSRAVIDVPVVSGTDLALVRRLAKQAADEVWHDPAFASYVLEEPEVWGVESLGPDGVVLRLTVKAAPLQQASVARAVRERLKAALDGAGVVTGVSAVPGRPAPTPRPARGATKPTAPRSGSQRGQR